VSHLLQGHWPQTFCLPQAAQRVGVLAFNTPIAVPARTIAHAPAAGATQAAA